MPETIPQHLPKNAAFIEAVLFDFGMVLCGPPDPDVWAQMRTLAALEEEGFHREYWAHRHAYDRGQHTGEAYWQLVAAGNGNTFSSAQTEGLIAADIALWTVPNHPMIAWTKRLQSTGIRTGILSNMGDAMEIGVRARFDWLRDFDHCTWSHSLQLAKPEAAIYRHAADGLATPPGKILFIDDRLENVQAALNFGMQSIQYHDYAQFAEEMKIKGLESLLDRKGWTLNQSNRARFPNQDI
jgi:putative hydrolase of the HAD superfamily